MGSLRSAEGPKVQARRGEGDDLCGQQTGPRNGPTEALFLSIVLEHEKEIIELRNRMIKMGRDGEILVNLGVLLQHLF